MGQTKKIIPILMVIGLLMLPAVQSIAADRVPMIPASFSDIAQQAKPGVVNIQTEKNIEGGGRVYRHFFGQPYNDNNRELFEHFWGPFFNQMPQTRRESSLGSGFIISKDGYIVTNNHVIKDADNIKVILHDKSEYEAEVVGSDSMTDLALIKIEAKDLKPLKFGSSSQTRVGAWVVAIGSPFGLEQTVTTGIVSAKGRIIGSGPYDDFIQTDASINPGNSGGPLLNLNGEVIGINTAIIRSGQGIGFAIPSDMATGIIDQLTRKKQVSRGWLGVGIQDITEQVADYYGVKDQKGVYVAKVYEDTPAEKYGIQAGDIITAINGKPVDKSRDLSFNIASYGVGETVKVSLIREGDEKVIKVKLGERPDQPSQAMSGITPDGYGPLGFRLKEMDDQIAGRLGYPEGTQGVVIADIKQNSQAALSGARSGDLILEINRHKIVSLKSYNRELSKIKKGGIARLLVRRGNSHVLVISLEKP